MDILLPVGISFYTFQALSYTIDVYKQKIQPTHDVVAFFAFISFFPQLVAGPIERATHLLPQFLTGKIIPTPPHQEYQNDILYRIKFAICSQFDYSKSVDGLRQILWGFFKKMIVADNCAAAVNLIWADYTTQSGFVLLMGGILFTFQIYGDFSGYSDIAIGTARLFGIDLMRNFNFPYFSRDIAEFWRRWHISLTTWFRDYIYIPLGGSRCGKTKAFRNTMVIFLVSGLWHGANWTFVVWGIFHALLFLPLLLLGKNRKYTNLVAENRWYPNVEEFVQMFTTFLLVVLGWIIFRAENIYQAQDYIAKIFSKSLFQIGRFPGKSAMLAIGVLMIVEWFQRDKQHALQFSNNNVIFRYSACRWCLYYLILFALIYYSGNQATFIYFQF